MIKLEFDSQKIIDLNSLLDQSIALQNENGLPYRKLELTLEYIRIHLHQTIKLVDLAQILGMSQYYFCHLFKQSMGISPYQYILQQRIERAKRLLQQEETVIVDVALQCGFANQSHFTSRFRRSTGTTPKVFREREHLKAMSLPMIRANQASAVSLID